MYARLLQPVAKMAYKPSGAIDAQTLLGTALENRLDHKNLVSVLVVIELEEKIVENHMVAVAFLVHGFNEAAQFLRYFVRHADFLLRSRFNAPVDTQKRIP